MRAILIDPEKRRITEIDFEGGDTEIEAIIGRRCVATAEFPLQEDWVPTSALTIRNAGLCSSDFSSMHRLWMMTRQHLSRSAGVASCSASMKRGRTATPSSAWLVWRRTSPSFRTNDKVELAVTLGVTFDAFEAD
jgi:hypothetical protein